MGSSVCLVTTIVLASVVEARQATYRHMVLGCHGKERFTLQKSHQHTRPAG